MKLVDDRPNLLKNAETHEIPKISEGYYAGDKPNPNLKKFVEDHMQKHPYDSLKDDYNVPAFDKAIETSKATAIYNMHTYWSKKPHDAIQQYIQHYTKPGDLVLDPFCGSGGTALAALIDGRAVIAIDRSPAATFITKIYCTPVDIRELKAAFEELKAKIKSEIDWLFETRCDRCGGKAKIAYTVYSQIFQCPRCMAKVTLFDCIEIEGQTAAGKPKKISVCPHCYKNGHEEEISVRGKRYGSIPVLVCYTCENGCKPIRDNRTHNDQDPKKKEFFEKFDLTKIKEIETTQIPYWYPTISMMNVNDPKEGWGLLWRPYHGDIRSVNDFFTKRNLRAISLYLSSIESMQCSSDIKDILKSSLTGVLYGLSKMNRYRPDVSFPLNNSANTLYVPSIGTEEEPWHHIENKFKKLINGMNEIQRQTHSLSNNILISTEDARYLTQIPNNSIDYVFTDPPYGYRIQYGEMNFIWEAWLNLNSSWHSDEIIINETRHLSQFDWASKLKQSLLEIFRVLKPGHWLSLCFHDSDTQIWQLLQDIALEVGFIPSTGFAIDTDYHTHKQHVSVDITKRDLVINFRKPRPGETTSILTITGDEDDSTFSQKVITIIRDYLTAHPGITKDRIYDDVVSRMVRAGQMEAHNFDDLLNRVAEPIKTEGSTGNGIRWYLKETELNAVDIAETNKEDAAAEKIGAFMAAFLQKNTEQEGVHYSDIFENFITAVTDRPRRPLAEWLLDYFYKTGEGTYRLPLTDAERLVKKEGRAKGIARKIKHYIIHLEQNIPLPQKIRPSDATIAEWIHHCRIASMYEQGKILYEKGGIRLDGLTDEQQAAVEEDYDVCARMIARGIEQPASQPKKGRKKKDIVII